MKRKWTVLALCTALLCLCLYAHLVEREQQEIAGRIIRLHVTANSDAAADQAIKLQVRDRVLPVAARLTANCRTKAEAAQALREGLPLIQAAANRALSAKGQTASACLGKERFPRRVYETFSLPAGSYDTLRVTLGKGAGRNWWCVAFPALCLPATSEGVAEAAALSGLSETQTQLLTEEGFTVSLKFRLLDLLNAIFS